MLSLSMMSAWIALIHFHFFLIDILGFFRTIAVRDLYCSKAHWEAAQQSPRQIKIAKVALLVTEWNFRHENFEVSSVVK